jgi:hypothetical protein
MELTIKEVRGLSWCDTRYFGYYWDTKFKNPTLVVKIIRANCEAQELVCDWSTNLKVEIDYLNHVNALLTLDVSFTQSPKSVYCVYIDFGVNGFIKFNCNNLSLRST